MAPHCSVFLGASLDGFIARKDGALDWLKPFDTLGEDYGFNDFFSSIDTVLLGRKTRRGAGLREVELWGQALRGGDAPTGAVAAR